MSARTLFLLVLGPLGALRGAGWFPAGRPTVVGLWCGLGLGALALVWAGWAVRRLMTWDQQAPLTTGPFAWGRHPMYLAMLGFVAASGAVSGEPFLVASLPVLVLGLDRGVVLAEEAELIRVFGDDYTAYQASVRRWWGRRRSA